MNLKEQIKNFKAYAKKTCNEHVAKDCLEIVEKLEAIIIEAQELLEHYSDPRAYQMIADDKVERLVIDNMHLPAKDFLDKTNKLMKGE